MLMGVSWVFGLWCSPSRLPAWINRAWSRMSPVPGQLGNHLLIWDPVETHFISGPFSFRALLALRQLCLHGILTEAVSLVLRIL